MDRNVNQAVATLLETVHVTSASNYSSVTYTVTLSPKNQERTADRYVYGRYGSWVNAKRFWLHITGTKINLFLNFQKFPKKQPSQVD